MNYLDFKQARCKDCFKCLRECPVKAIKFENHQAHIVEERCILCGTCTSVCPQNAKQVNSELAAVEALLMNGAPAIASVAPSFVSSFGVQNFSIMQLALTKLGFAYTEETAVGAQAVSAEYVRLLERGGYKNFITSACPAINRMIQMYYPVALPYLAPVASPLIAHGRLLKESFPNAKVVFIGPCIAKKREAAESGVIDAVLTFEELQRLFTKRNIVLEQIADISIRDNGKTLNRAQYYPISRGIIKSFIQPPDTYEYVTVDGVRRCCDVLEEIESYSGLFIEMNCCEYACINGPCILKNSGGAIKANKEIRDYVHKNAAKAAAGANTPAPGANMPAPGANMPAPDANTPAPRSLDLTARHRRLPLPFVTPSERDIRFILAQTGKLKAEDELNCGACGYSTCREKAVSVANGLAAIDMCLPFMRTRAESMSYEIIQNSPNGILVLDGDYKILEINSAARAILGITAASAKGLNAFDCFNCDDYLIAGNEGKSVHKRNVFIDRTGKYAEMSIILLQEHKIMFGVYKDISDKVEFEKKLAEVKNETLNTTDSVIQKQMRVAQEIASLLGETTAETKVALLKLKKTLQREHEPEEG
ncbi:MAG: 4Fe-4S binding protein [Treponema sp.]|jgi:PAS domain S-box-containing protein|nr:4Fe-4S binding protein [Treponema sp.]